MIRCALCEYIVGNSAGIVDDDYDTFAEHLALEHREELDIKQYVVVQGTVDEVLNHGDSA